jgi:hypothetical protein
MVVSIAPDNSSLAKELERIRFDLLEGNVSVKFLQDYSGFSFEGISIPAASKGSRVEVPFFIAEILFNNSIIEDYLDDFPSSLQDLTNAVRNEVRSGKLQPLHPFYYILAKEIVLNEEDQDSQFDEVELKRKESKYNQLINERIAKIVKMADSRAPLPRRSNLTSSEKILLIKINELIQSWKAEIEKITN